MAIKFILDENVYLVYQTQFLQKNPELVMWAIGDPGTPPKSTLDPEILCWCEAENFVLVTNNRKSMPVHLADHIAQGRHVPGILILNANLTIGETIEELTLIAEAAFEDQIVHLPLPPQR